jgi:hypothetical protein
LEVSLTCVDISAIQHKDLDKGIPELVPGVRRGVTIPGGPVLFLGDHEPTFTGQVDHFIQKFEIASLIREHEAHMDEIKRMGF